MDSFLNLRLPSSFEGDPQTISQELLAPIFAASESALLLCSNFSPELLAQLTCGMGPFLRQTQLNLIVLVENATSFNAEKAHRDWATALQSEEITDRLSLFKCFESAEKLKVKCLEKESHETGALLRAGLDEEPGLLLLKDAAGTGLMILWQRPLDLKSREEVAARICWSFGDPSRRVEMMLKDADVFLGKASPQPCMELEENITSLIRDLPLPQLPWTETFARSGPEKIELFPHQENAITAWEENARRGIFRMCTGAGKTITSLACVDKINREGQRPYPPVLVTVPTRVLADQWVEQIKRMGFMHVLRAYESSNNWLAPLEPWMKDGTADSSRFVVSTYRTFSDPRFITKLKQLGEKGVRAVWIADEMHNLASATLLEAMHAVGNVCPDRIGLSATPDIEGNIPVTEKLVRYFNGVCASYELKDGIQDGVLCPYNYYPCPAYLDPAVGERYLETLHDIEQAGSKSTQLLNLYRESREIVRKSGVQLPAFGTIVDDISSRGGSISHTLVYCPPGYTGSAETSDESCVEEEQERLLEQIVDACRQRGIVVASIIGTTPSAQRDDTLERFATGEIQVLCAIGCLDEGIDIPTIQRAIVLYSVDRERQFVQRRGRILRQPRGVKKVADIHDVIILPHGTKMNRTEAEHLLTKELRRYQIFSDLALNREEARKTIDEALKAATDPEVDGPVTP